MDKELARYFVKLISEDLQFSFNINEEKLCSFLCLYGFVEELYCE